MAKENNIAKLEVEISQYIDLVKVLAENLRATFDESADSLEPDKESSFENSKKLLVEQIGKLQLALANLQQELLDDISTTVTGWQEDALGYFDKLKSEIVGEIEKLQGFTIKSFENSKSIITEETLILNNFAKTRLSPLIEKLCFSLLQRQKNKLSDLQTEAKGTIGKLLEKNRKDGDQFKTNFRKCICAHINKVDKLVTNLIDSHICQPLNNLKPECLLLTSLDGVPAKIFVKGGKSAEIQTDFAVQSFQFPDGLEHLHVKINNEAIENKISTLLSFVPSNGKGREKKIDDFRVKAESIFRDIWKEARKLRNNLASQSKIPLPNPDEFKDLASKEIKQIKVVPSTQKEGNNLNEKIQSMEERLRSLKEWRNFREQSSILLKRFICEAENIATQFANRHFHNTYDKYLDRITNKFDRTFAWKSLEITPVAIFVVLAVFVAYFIYPSSVIIQLRIEILLTAAILATVMSTVLVSYKWKMLSNNISKYFRSYLKKIIPDHEIHSGYCRFSFIPLKIVSKHSDIKKIEELGKQFEQLKSKYFWNGVSAQFEYFLGIISIASYALVICAIIFGAMHKQFKVAQIYTKAPSNIDYLHPLIEGRIFSADNDYYYVRDPSNWINNSVIPRDMVQSILNTECPKLQEGNCNEVLRIKNPEYKESKPVIPRKELKQFIELELSKLKTAIAEKQVTTIIQPLYLPSPGSGSGVGLVDAGEELKEWLKNNKLADLKPSEIPVSVITPITIMPEQKSTNLSQFITTIYLDGKEVELPEHENVEVVLAPIFNRLVTAKILGNAELSTDLLGADGISNPTEAFWFGLVSLLQGPIKGTKNINQDQKEKEGKLEMDLAVVNAMADILKQCSTPEKMNGLPKIDVHGFADEQWMGEGALKLGIPKDPMNYALSQGRKLAIIAGLLKKLEKEMFKNHPLYKGLSEEEKKAVEIIKDIDTPNSNVSASLEPSSDTFESSDSEASKQNHEPMIQALLKLKEKKVVFPFENTSNNEIKTRISKWKAVRKKWLGIEENGNGIQEAYTNLVARSGIIVIHKNGDGLSCN